MHELPLMSDAQVSYNSLASALKVKDNAKIIQQERVLDEDSARRMAEYCDIQEGFYCEGTGCILPRELRSPVYLYHICSHARLTPEDKEMLYRLKYGVSGK